MSFLLWVFSFLSVQCRVYLCPMVFRPSAVWQCRSQYYMNYMLWCLGRSLAVRSCCVVRSGSRSNKTFKPKKNIPEGTHQYDLMRHAAATLGSGNLRLAVMLPEGEDLNEWVAVNSKPYLHTRLFIMLVFIHIFILEFKWSDQFHIIMYPCHIPVYLFVFGVCSQKLIDLFTLYL